MLRKQNYDVNVAVDGFEAGLAINKIMPDLLILDLMMPNVDGFKVCELIKQDPSYKDIKILILTGYADEKNIKKANECGADKILSKPAEVDEILEAINSLV